MFWDFNGPIHGDFMFIKEMQNRSKLQSCRLLGILIGAQHLIHHGREGDQMR